MIFDDEQDDVIRRIYPEYGAGFVADKLGKTEQQIITRARRLGVKRRCAAPIVQEKRRPPATYSNKGYWQFGI